MEKGLCAGEHRHGEVTHREAEYQYPSHSSLAPRFLSSPSQVKVSVQSDHE